MRFRHCLNFMMILIMISSLPACSAQVDKVSQPVYEGFRDADYSLTRNACEDQGFVVLEGIDIADNSDLINHFMALSHTGEEAVLRIAHFKEGGDQVSYYSDLVYNQEGYVIHYDEKKDHQIQPYQYIKVVSGTFGNPPQNDNMIILCDRESMTFDDVHRSMLSSNTEEIDRIGRFSIVFYRY